MDPILRFDHDHAHLGALLAALREGVKLLQSGTVTRDELAELLHTSRVLQDDMMAHFALEEEGLFPFALGRFPDVARRISSVVESHDRLCGVLSRMAFHLERCGAGQDEDLGPLSGVLSRFMELYDDHAHHERELLHVLHARLDEAGRREVAKILAPLEGDR